MQRPRARSAGAGRGCPQAGPWGAPMGLDLSQILDEWPYEPGKINVRLVEGDDQEPRIQLRIDLGIMQLRTSGRPDGLRPFGYESLLEHHEQRLDQHVEEHGSASGFVLSEDECR